MTAVKLLQIISQRRKKMESKILYVRVPKKLDDQLNEYVKRQKANYYDNGGLHRPTKQAVIWAAIQNYIKSQTGERPE